MSWLSLALKALEPIFKEHALQFADQAIGGLYGNYRGLGFRDEQKRKDEERKAKADQEAWDKQIADFAFSGEREQVPFKLDPQKVPSGIMDMFQRQPESVRKGLIGAIPETMPGKMKFDLGELTDIGRALYEGRESGKYTPEFIARTIESRPDDIFKPKKEASFQDLMSLVQAAEIGGGVGAVAAKLPLFEEEMALIPHPRKAAMKLQGAPPTSALDRFKARIEGMRLVGQYQQSDTPGGGKITRKEIEDLLKRVDNLASGMPEDKAATFLDVLSQAAINAFTPAEPRKMEIVGGQELGYVGIDPSTGESTLLYPGMGRRPTGGGGNLKTLSPYKNDQDIFNNLPLELQEKTIRKLLGNPTTTKLDADYNEIAVPVDLGTLMIQWNRFTTGFPNWGGMALSAMSDETLTAPSYDETKINEVVAQNPGSPEEIVNWIHTNHPEWPMPNDDDIDRIMDEINKKRESGTGLSERYYDLNRLGNR